MGSPAGSRRSVATRARGRGTRGDGWNEFRFIRFVRARVVARVADGVVGVVPSERSRTPYSKNSKTLGLF